MSIFSIISYIYRKIPDPGNDGENYCISSVAYPFSYPFFATLSKFPLKLQQVTENKDFSKKFFIFSDAHIFFLVPELFLAMQPPACPERVFFIYGCGNSFLNHFLLSILRSPPWSAPSGGRILLASAFPPNFGSGNTLSKILNIFWGNKMGQENKKPLKGTQRLGAENSTYLH